MYSSRNRKKNRNQNIEKSISQYKNSIWLYESRLSVIKKNEEIIETKSNDIPNFNKIFNESKRLPKEQEKKEITIKETPKEPEKYILPEITSINPHLKNPYDNKKSKEEKIKETPKGFLIPNSESIISNVNNPYSNKGNFQNNNINNNNINNTNSNERQFKITPGNSINRRIEENPYKQDVQSLQFKITPEGSQNPIMNYNPYSNNRETPHGPNNYFIPKQSISHDRGNLFNPYNKDYKNSNKYQEKQKNNIDSRINENISTNNSNNDENVKNSNLVRRTNYDIDKV